MIPIVRLSACALAVGVALVACAKGEDLFSEGSQVGGASGSSTGKGGMGGAGGASITVTSPASQSASTGSSGECAPVGADSDCRSCAKSKCCEAWVSCLGDDNCTCWFECRLEDGQSAFDCEDKCGPEGGTFSGLFECVSTACFVDCF